MKTSGKCLCEKIQFEFKIKERHIDACHCGMCRKWGGGPLIVVESDGAIEFKNKDHLKIYSSSDWAERGFCSNCGTHLFYRLKERPLWCIPYGTLDDQSGYEFTKQIFVDKKPDSYEFGNQTKMMTENEVFEAAGASES